MTIPETPDARVRQASEVAENAGGKARSDAPEVPSDSLDLRYRILGKVAGRLSPEGMAAMEGLLQTVPTTRQKDLNQLILAVGAEDPGDVKRRREREKDLFDAIDQVMDAGSGGMGNLFTAMQGMSPEDQQNFLQTLSGLLKRGVMGYEYRKVRGQPYKIYLENEIGSDIHRQKLYKKQLNSIIS